MKAIVDKLEARRAKARAGGGQARIEAQHKRGKLTAREPRSPCKSRGNHIARIIPSQAFSHRLGQGQNFADAIR